MLASRAACPPQTRTGDDLTGAEQAAGASKCVEYFTLLFDQEQNE